MENNCRPLKSNITFDEFQKLDIRMCQIMTCSRVPKTRSLYLLEINTGTPETGMRQVVSSIADFMTEEQLIGKIFPFVLNLEPREIRGIRSEAMIILSSRTHDGSFVNLSTNNKEDIGAIMI